MKPFAEKFGNMIWTIITALVMLAFYFGYTKGEVEKKADKTEVLQMITEAIAVYDQQKKGNYIRIDQVPGLQEKLNSIDEGMKENKVMIQKIYDRMIDGR